MSITPETEAAINELLTLLSSVHDTPRDKESDMDTHTETPNGADEVAALRERVDTLEQDKAALREQATTLLGQLAQHETWRAELENDMHAIAEDNGWCEEFDTFMEEHGMRTREREWTGEVVITVDFRVQPGNVKATNDDAASDKLSEAAEEALADALSATYLSWDQQDVQVDSLQRAE